MVYLLQLNVIKFVTDLSQVDNFLKVSTYVRPSWSHGSWICNYLCNQCFHH